MRYIVPCSSCRTELRIPVNLGKLTVRCPRCYHSFLFDPDDKSSYVGGRYESDEESPNPRSLRGFFLFMENLWKKTKERFFPKRNETLGWQSPSSPREYADPNSRSFYRKSFAQRFARNFLLALIFIGIVRACFFGRDRMIFQEEPIPPIQEEPERRTSPPSSPDEPKEEPPQYEI
ncbi:hypothetical protein EHO61_16480 [Leptospira fluminis]|uniref:Uncharacterized protein n=1 Tax=Leptospira fluminis TaxID=2484979 RepID=A0A4R9GKB6_9LEPT|nr:hypothetical protein EHO61_16480 [Leptospira fluminis]